MEASAFLQSKYNNGSSPSIQLQLFNALCGNRPARGRNVAIRKAINMKAEVGELCEWGSMLLCWISPHRVKIIRKSFRKNRYIVLKTYKRSISQCRNAEVCTGGDEYGLCHRPGLV